MATNGKDALQQALRNLAKEETRGTARLSDSRRTRKRLLSAQKQMLSLQKQSAFLPPAVCWYLDNYAYLEETADLSPQKLRLPRLDGGVRAKRLIELAAFHLDGHLDLSSLRFVLKEFLALRPLSMAEMWAVPACMRICLLESCASLAGELAGDLRLGVQAASAAQALLQAGCGLSTLPPRFLCPAGVYAIHETLKGTEEAAALAEALEKLGLRLEALLASAREKQALDEYRMSGCISSLKSLASLRFEPLFEELSPVERLLRSDKTGIYASCDKDTRELLRTRLAQIAHAHRATELDAAKALLLLCDGGSGRKERQIGYYLLEEKGVRRFSRVLGGASPAFSLRLFVRLHIRPIYFFLYFSLALLAVALCLKLSGPLLAFLSLLPALGLSARWLAAFFARLIPPRRLCRLDFSHGLPGHARTAVCVPALLSSPARVRAAADTLERAYLGNRQDGLFFVLLGDYADHSAPEREDDKDILIAAQEAIRTLNHKYGERFYYLHRPRSFSQTQGNYMGWERKRGALQQLNRAVLSGSSRDFICCCPSLEGLEGVRYVLTLDVDTYLPPEAAARLVGAIAHPLNRDHGVLAPRVQSLFYHDQTLFSYLLSLGGGVDSYVTAVSETYQDLFGQGIFGGKGVYDLRAMEKATGHLPQNAILSHDLLEGLLANAALVSDVCVYERQMGTLRAWTARQRRWVRGDWQLLPFLFLPQLSLMDRHKLLDNLRRSLSPLFACLAAVFCGPFGLLALLFELGLPRNPAWVLRFLLLPFVGVKQLSAACVSLYRVLISRRGLLSWTTAADVGDKGELAPLRLWPCCLAGALSLSPLLLPLWGLAPLLCRLLSRPAFSKETLEGEDRAYLLDLARRSYGWFEKVLRPEDHFLPPDNVQLQPGPKAARRTSPTNIGLSLLSHAAAWSLGLIDAPLMAKRMQQTLETLEKLDKWKGHPYNWYSTGDLSVLLPRYVSSVDNGNLCACLWAAAACLKKAGELGLMHRCERLCKAMDFSLLYDKDCDQFYIGYDETRQEPSRGHYDLLASESLLLSFVAIMKGDAPLRHYSALARPLAPVGREAVLLSWSGTMFEYLMPFLLLKPAPKSLLLQSARSAVRAQRQAAGDRRPFGESESGFYAFDPELNYQYRAFGLPELSMRFSGGEDVVVSPYAGALALLVAPRAAAKNLRAMESLGWATEDGFFEAADYSNPGADGKNLPYALVRSHMAHHQGMLLLALEGALEGRVREGFMSLPMVRAYDVLLQESAVRGRVRPRQRLQRPEEIALYTPENLRYSLPADELACQLLSGGDASLQVLSFGLSRLSQNGMALYRAAPGEEGLRFYLNGQRVVFTRLVHEAGVCTLSGSAAGLNVTLAAALSPEDGSLGFTLQIHGLDENQEAVLCACFEPVLLPAQNDEAHPAFEELFLQMRPLGQSGLEISRRTRDGSPGPALRFVLFGNGAAAGLQSERAQLLGRGRSYLNPKLAAAEPERLMRTPLQSCAAVFRRFSGCEGNAAVCKGLLSLQALSEPLELFHQRLFAYAAIRARAEAAAFSLTPAFLRSTARVLGCLLRPDLVDGQRARAAEESRLPLSALWRFSLSGEKPLILVWLHEEEQLPLAAEAAKLHRYLLHMGFDAQLCLVSAAPADYFSRLKNDLSALAPSAVLLEESMLSADEMRLLQSRAAVLLDGRLGKLRGQLMRIKRPQIGLPPLLAADGPFLALPAKALVDTCPYGGFVPDGAAYIVTRTPPMPWSNVMANPAFGSLVTERFGGYTFYKNAREGRLTPFSNDPIADARGEGVFLLNAESGAGDDLCERMEHGLGYSRGESGRLGVYASLTQAVHPSLPVKLMELNLHNPTDKPRRLLAFAYALWVLGEHPGQTRMSVKTQNRGRSLLAANPLNSLHAVLHLVDELPFAFTCDAAELRAARQGSASLSGRCGCGVEPCALFRVELCLKPNESARLRFLLGAADCEEAGLALPARVDADGFLDSVRAYWRDFLAPVCIQTPSARLDRLVNYWLPYQALSGRLYGRTGFYQSGGAYGFRDQLQDAAMLAFYAPHLLKEQILLCAAHQFEEGDVQHWWHPERRGVRTRISDDLLFLPWAVAQYLRLTGDSALLDEPVPFLKAAELAPGEEDRYFEPETGQSASLREHCLRALRRACRLGAHGLPLMGSGDWNDAMNRVGRQGRGESVFVGFFLCQCIRDFLPYAKEDAAFLADVQRHVGAALETHAFIKDRYLRAFFDDGSPLGGADAAECRIDLTAQALSVLSGAASEEHARLAMDRALRALHAPGLRMLRLLDPPFDGKGQNPGYIAGYVPGVRENGGQYTHAAAWAVLALCALRDPRGPDLLLELLPTGREQDRYQVEPYVAAADIYAGEHPGRGGWTWYTGSAGWLWRAAIEGVLGLRVRKDGFKLDPCPPRDWEGFSLEYHGKTLCWKSTTPPDGGAQSPPSESPTE